MLDERVRNNMTYRQLQSYIRQATKEVNDLIESEDTPSIETQKIKRDVQSRYKGKIGVGFSGKTKKDLFIQARALQDYIDAKEDDFGYDDKIAKQWESFINSPKGFDISFEDYRELVNVMGTLGSDLKQSFDYGYYSAFNEYIDDLGVLNITKIMDKTIKESKNKGWNTEQMNEVLVNNIKQAIKEKVG